MNIPREFIDLLLTKIDVVDVINIQVPLRKKTGANYFARCPFHQEKSASFSVSQTKQFYYCFGCGAHGNAIDFMINHDRLSFPEAIETLARLAGMEVPRDKDAPKKSDPLPALFDMMNKAAAYFYQEMRLSDRAIQYLKNRGISGEIAKLFQIGYARNSFHHLLDQLGKNESDKKHLLQTGLIIEKKEGGYYDRFRDRIMFPIADYRGRLIGFGGRILDQGEPKYLNSPETLLFQKGHELYGLYQAVKSNRQLTRLVIVEGYMDVIALFQYGINYAVATLGTATTAHHLQRLMRYTTELVFCFDGDQAGRTAAWRAVQVIFPLMQDSWQIRFLFLPEGEDPDSLVRKEGGQAFEARFKKALPLSDFFFQTLANQSDMNTLEGRAKFASSALGFIKQLPAGVFQNMVLDELAKQARMDVSALKQPAQAKTQAAIEAPADLRQKLSPPLRLALALLIQQPSLLQNLQMTLLHCELPGFALLLSVIEIIRAQPHITTGMILERWRDQPQGTLIAHLAQFDHLIPETGMENEFLGAIRQLTLSAINAEIERLLAKAARGALSEEEKLELSTLIAKKQTLIG